MSGLLTRWLKVGENATWKKEGANDAWRRPKRASTHQPPGLERLPNQLEERLDKPTMPNPPVSSPSVGLVGPSLDQAPLLSRVFDQRPLPLKLSWRSGGWSVRESHLLGSVFQPGHPHIRCLLLPIFPFMMAHERKIASLSNSILSRSCSLENAQPIMWGERSSFSISPSQDLNIWHTNQLNHRSNIDHLPLQVARLRAMQVGLATLGSWSNSDKE